VRSSRRLEAETHRNIEVISLLRHLKPDFKTIADFRRDNRNAFRQVFREFVLLCRQLDLFGRQLLAVGGTRIKAVNNKDRNFTRASLTQFIKAADAKLDDYLQRLDKSDATESAKGGSRVENLAEKIAAIRERRERHKDMLAELDRTGESQISLTDPDSRVMAAHTHVAVGYNIQVAVDAKHKLIVEQQVTKQVVDMGLLTQTADPAKEVLGVERIAVVADRGYFKIEDIEACEKAGIKPYVPRPQREPSVRAGLYRKDEFSYDAATDSFLCSAGQQLQAYSPSLLRGLKKINYVNKPACRVCAVRSLCTGNTFRTVSRLENEAVLENLGSRCRPGVWLRSLPDLNTQAGTSEGLREERGPDRTSRFELYSGRPADIFRSLQESLLDHDGCRYHWGIPGPDFAGRCGVRMTERKRSRSRCRGERSAAFGKGAASVRSSIPSGAPCRRFRDKASDRLDPDFWTAREKGPAAVGVYVVGWICFSGTAICTYAVGSERKHNDFRGPSDIARFDPSESGCFKVDVPCIRVT
jgi:Transposase DDE domain